MTARALALALAVLVMGSARAEASPPESRPEPVAVIDALYPEGPVVIDGALVVAEMTADRLRVVTRAGDGVASRFIALPPGCGPTALAEIAGARRLVLCHLAGALLALDAEDRVVAEIREDDAGRRFVAPNDVHADGAGGAFFTDAGVFSTAAPAEGVVYRLTPDLTARAVVAGLRYANGVAADASALYVSEHLAKRFWRFARRADGSVDAAFGAALDAADLGLAPARDLVGPDGVELAGAARRYVALYGAGRIIRFERETRRDFLVPQPFVTNIAIWGDWVAVTGAYDNSRRPYPGAIALYRRGDL